MNQNSTSVSAVEVTVGSLDAGGVDPLLRRLVGEGGEALRHLGFRSRLQILGRAGARFLDPEDPLRREAEARIPADAGLSPRAAREVVEGMAREWRLERLATAVRADFPDPDVLDGFRPGVRGEMQRVVPPRLLVQIGSGNVPGTTATALLRGLLVGAPTLVKPGTGDQVLPGLLARALSEASPELARGFVVAHWPGGEGGALEAQALAGADRVVIYGGDEAVTAVRSRVPAAIPVVVYGPRISAGVVLRDAAGAREPVEAAAGAVLAYGQQGCVSPHQIWVEEGGARSPEAWAGALAEALARQGGDRRLPATDPAVRGWVEGARWRAASGSGEVVHGGPEEGWTVLWDPAEGGLEPTCLGHTVRVRPLSGAAALPPLLEPLRHRLQSMAVEGGEPGRSTLALHLARQGVSRITTFGRQPWPPAWWKHDGAGALAALVSWATLDPSDRAGPS
jgi:hypothetical protein